MILQAPEEIFEREKTYEKNLRIDGGVERIELTHRGIFVYHKGHKHPKKGYPTPEVCEAVAAVKRAFMVFVNIATSKPLRYLLLPILLLPTSVLVGILDSSLGHFSAFTRRVLKWWYLKPKYYCKSAQEIYRVGMDLAGDNKIYQLIVKAIVMIWEFDDSYRFRGQDILGELKKENLVNVKKEINRLLGIYFKREQAGVSNKVRRMKMFLPILMRKPIKKVVKRFLSRLDVSRVVLDEGDMYWCSFRTNYNFKGLPFDKRKHLQYGEE